MVFPSLNQLHPGSLTLDRDTHKGLELMGGSALLGLMGEALFWAAPWGLNIVLWGMALVGLTFGLSVRWRVPFATTERWLLLSCALLLLSYAGRGDATLRLLTTLALFGMVVLMLHRSQPSMRRWPQPFSWLRTLLRAYFGLPTFLLRRMAWAQLLGPEQRALLVHVLRGVLLALPILFLFGGLLAMGDPAFAALFTVPETFDLGTAFTQLAMMVLLAWVAGGFLHGILVAPLPQPDVADEKEPTAEATEAKIVWWGTTEVLVVLGLVNALFATFVVVQLPYLFGGATYLSGTPDLSAATYARRGFFELATVVALAVPVLLFLHNRLQRLDTYWMGVFRRLAGVQVVLLWLMLGSAAHRMWLYQSLYGLTTLRLYISVCIVWMALVLGWFVLTVLRGQATRFARGAMGLALACLISLHILNPEALVVRTNIDRAAAGYTFDASYTYYLSADAVPALVDGLGHLSACDQSIIAQRMWKRWGPETANRDWRSWTLSRARAQKVVQAHQHNIVAAADLPCHR